MKKFWKFFKYVMSGQMSHDQMTAYVESKNPTSEAERIKYVREYWHTRGKGY